MTGVCRRPFSQSGLHAASANVCRHEDALGNELGSDSKAHAKRGVTVHGVLSADLVLPEDPTHVLSARGCALVAIAGSLSNLQT